MNGLFPVLKCALAMHGVLGWSDNTLAMVCACVILAGKTTGNETMFVCAFQSVRCAYGKTPW